MPTAANSRSAYILCGRVELGEVDCRGQAQRAATNQTQQVTTSSSLIYLKIHLTHLISSHLIDQEQRGQREHQNKRQQQQRGRPREQQEPLRVQQSAKATATSKPHVPTAKRIPQRADRTSSSLASVTSQAKLHANETQFEFEQKNRNVAER